jgi:hypothetical protein
MQYMLLIYTDPMQMPPVGSAEISQLLAGYRKATDTYKADKVWLAGDALQAADTATTVRLRGGKVQTMDGPFIETKEVLAGYYLLDCEDLDAAIKYAAMIPGAANGAIEVRPILDLSKFS